jgi:DNA (cytosine-5)-methyltransferase 1
LYLGKQALLKIAADPSSTILLALPGSEVYVPRREKDGSQRRVAELFAGVGGFRLALERRSVWNVVWSNQWEPNQPKQLASKCYVEHFGPEGHVCDDVANVARALEADHSLIPDHELLTAGFPCQDYSVAKPVRSAHGLEGKKGVLWWEILRVLQVKKPPFVLLENVDRLLQSPSTRRGRDFAVMLSCLRQLDYSVEWRVVNAADYGFPQRRRRVFVLARPEGLGDDPYEVVHRSGVLARAFRVKASSQEWAYRSIPDDPVEVSERFEEGPFGPAGFMGLDGKYCSFSPDPHRPSPSKRRSLKDALETRFPIPDEYFVARGSIGNVTEPDPGTWRYFKGPKSEPRTKLVNGEAFEYHFQEGGIRFPDSTDEPARTILTGEGGSSPSRSKHVIRQSSRGRYRRLIPEELERLNGFPPGWTKGMSATKRAFMMGNALVVGVVARIGNALDEVADDLV